MNRINAPRGTRDIVYPEISHWQMLEARIREFYSRFLYREIRTPMFERSELFQRGIGDTTEVVQKEMYTFQDKAGRSLTLRPENTASVVRAAIENNLFDALFPLRFFYIGPMFRYDKPQKGRYRQFHQFGIEVFREESAELDAEVVYAAYAFLEELGLREISLEINSVGCDECRPAYLRVLQQAAQARRDELCADCRRKVDSNPLRIFDCKQPGCRSAAATLPTIAAHLCPGCAGHFVGLQAGLDTYSVPYKVNERMVRGLDYYTRTAFEITSDRLGAQNAILGGGRYNRLIRDLGGPDIPGVGFAAGMERLLLHLEISPENEPSLCFLACQSAEFRPQVMKLARVLWQAGYHAYVDYSNANLKKQFRRSDRMAANFTLVLGEEEAAEGKVTVKDMTRQEQVRIPQQELLKWMNQRK
ncbi:MAG TPA: histidine--tRNA ligase [Candidatus Aminicenantes bacterium]|nr:histidine--tRNA ligase [Candidatus Aminicenantes bacterium]